MDGCYGQIQDIIRSRRGHGVIFIHVDWSCSLSLSRAPSLSMYGKPVSITHHPSIHIRRSTSVDPMVHSRMAPEKKQGGREGVLDLSVLCSGVNEPGRSPAGRMRPPAPLSAAAPSCRKGGIKLLILFLVERDRQTERERERENTYHTSPPFPIHG